jgi:hypothetical protein
MKQEKRQKFLAEEDCLNPDEGFGKIAALFREKVVCCGTYPISSVFLRPEGENRWQTRARRPRLRASLECAPEINRQRVNENDERRTALE